MPCVQLADVSGRKTEIASSPRAVVFRLFCWVSLASKPMGIQRALDVARGNKSKRTEKS
jgi:hypothetical protein